MRVGGRVGGRGWCRFGQVRDGSTGATAAPSAVAGRKRGAVRREALVMAARAWASPRWMSGGGGRRFVALMRHGVAGRDARGSAVTRAAGRPGAPGGERGFVERD